MLFFMASSSHLPLVVNPTANLSILWGVMLVIFGLLQFNAMKGKTGPMTTVKGVIHMGLVFTIVLYALVEVLTK